MAKAIRAAPWVAGAGAVGVAVAYAWLAVTVGTNQWGYSFGVSSAGALAAALGLWALGQTWGTRTAAAGFIVAAAGAANVLRLTLAYPTVVDVTALTLAFVGFLAGGYVFVRRPVPNPDGVLWLLAGSAGGLVWLVNDVARGFTNQWVPDALLLAGFALVWFGLRARSS